MAKKWAHVTIRIRSDDEQERLSALEEALDAEGVCFDTGYDVEEGSRDWELDSSLEGPLSSHEVIQRLREAGFKFKVQWRSAKSKKWRVNYQVGDIFRFSLNKKGLYGFGRVLLENSPFIFVEFYGIASRTNPPLETLRKTKCVLRIFTGDMGLIGDKSWKVIGNIPLESKITLPLFWKKNNVTGKLYLRTGPIFAQSDLRETTMDEIKQLGAQPGGVYGHDAAVKRLVLELETQNIL